MGRLFLNAFIWCANMFCNAQYKSRIKGVFADLYREKADKAIVTGQHTEFKAWVDGWVSKIN